MAPRKLFIDSRARQQGNPSDFTWQPGRPLMIGTSRAYLDAIHMPCTWTTIHAQNKYIYLTEQLALLTVLPSANKLYLTETSSSGVATQRIVNVPAAIYDGLALAVALSTALTSGGTTYTATWSAGSGGLGQIVLTASGIASFSIAARKELQALTQWGGQAITPTNLRDMCDVLAVLTQSVQGNPITFTLSPGLAYRKVELTEGTYTFTEAAVELKSKLDAGTTLSSMYVVTANQSIH